MTSQIAGGTNLIVPRSKDQSPIWNCHDLWVLCQFWRVHDLSIRLKIRPPALQAYWILWPSPSLDDFQFHLCRASITGSPEVFPTAWSQTSLRNLKMRRESPHFMWLPPGAILSLWNTFYRRRQATHRVSGWRSWKSTHMWRWHLDSQLLFVLKWAPWIKMDNSDGFHGILCNNVIMFCISM